KSAIRYVRHVNDHTYPVHFLHHFHAERAQPIPCAFGIVRRAADRVVPRMRKGDVANAAIEEVLYIIKRLTNGCTVLHTQWKCNLSLGGVLYDVFGREG